MSLHAGPSGSVSSSAYPLLAPDGSAAAPPYSFTSANSTGMYLGGAGDLGFSVGGTLRFDITSSSAIASVPILIVNGTAGAPSLAFTSDADGTGTGIYRVGVNSMGISANGVLALTIDTSGVTAAGPLAASNLSGANSGDVTIGTFGSSPTAKGISISSQVITLQPADGTNAGAVSATTQTFAGAKTFSGGITLSGGSATNNTIFLSSNVLTARGGTSGFSITDTSDAQMLGISNASVFTIGKSNNAATHTINGKVIQLVGPTGGDNSVRLLVQNQSTTAASTQVYLYGTATGTGDQLTVYSQQGDGTADWGVGRDASNSGAFSISFGGTLGTSEFFNISTAGLVTLGTGTSTQHAFNTLLASNGAQIATLTNLPAAATSGNPNGWFKMSINGTTSYMPFWH